jgi:hypothetical protein
METEIGALKNAAVLRIMMISDKFNVESVLKGLSTQQ